MNGRISSARKQLKTLSSSASLMRADGYVLLRRKSLNYSFSRLTAAQKQLISNNQRSYLALTAKLDALSPLKVLTRGYAIAVHSDGKVIRSAADVRIGDRMQVTVRDGVITADVQNVGGNEHGKKQL